jgi:hypothetical protein
MREIEAEIAFGAFANRLASRHAGIMANVEKGGGQENPERGLNYFFLLKPRSCKVDTYSME